MNSFIEFFSFSDPNVAIVSLGTVFLGLSAAVVGTFAFLRKRSLIGDAISHAILPGVALSFMAFQSKNPYLLLAGALLTGWLAIWVIEHLSSSTKLKPDTNIALVLSVFFGVGILFMTSIQHSGAGNQAGLDQFLFGKAASMRMDDVKAYSIVASLLLLTVVLFYKEFKLLCFNPDFAIISGLPVRTLNFVLSTITVLAIAIGIQSVGVVLMAALLITPAAAARAWTENLLIMIILAAITGAVSGLMGSYISFTALHSPTGPWIVMCLSGIALFSLFLAPKRGVLARIRRQRKNRQKILSENLLKTFYHLLEGSERKNFDRQTLVSKRDLRISEFRIAIRTLKKQFLIISEGSSFQLTRKGFEEAKRVVRLHRLWEMYLTKRMRLKADHIHPNAETIEHIITPEIEEQLLRELDYPEKDPHESPIPYS